LRHGVSASLGASIIIISTQALMLHVALAVLKTSKKTSIHLTSNCSGRLIFYAVYTVRL